MNTQSMDKKTKAGGLLAVSGAILCGGASSRMGRPKAFLPYAGKTLIEYRFDSMKAIFSQVVLVANAPDDYAHITDDVVKDIIPQRGPLVGILSALLVAEFDHTFVIACDMPLVDNALIQEMAAARTGTDVLVAAHEDGIEPLLGIYSKRCIPPLEEAIFSGSLKVQDFLSGVKAKLYDVGKASWQSKHNLPTHFNVNTPKDYCLLVSV